MEEGKNKIRELMLKAIELRQDVIRMLVEAKSGHTAGSLGMADIFTALYFEVMNHKPNQPDWDGRDRLVLSNGHICPIQYAAMAHAGYFPKQELASLRKLGSRLQGHPHRGSIPGIEVSGGPLGQGFSQACGMALVAKREGKKHIVYCLTGDGEHDEGEVWEAALFASKYKLSNLIQVLDRNHIQIDGNTDDVMPLEPVGKKYEAFGWNVIEIGGNDMEQILDGFGKAKELSQNTSKPTIIIAKTIAGKGVVKFENNYKYHGVAPKPDEAKVAIKELEKQKEKIANGAGNG